MELGERDKGSKDGAKFPVEKRGVPGSRGESRRHIVGLPGAVRLLVHFTWSASPSPCPPGLSPPPAAVVLSIPPFYRFIAHTPYSTISFPASTTCQSLVGELNALLDAGRKLLLQGLKVLRLQRVEAGQWQVLCTQGEMGSDVLEQQWGSNEKRATHIWHVRAAVSTVKISTPAAAERACAHTTPRRPLLTHPQCRWGPVARGWRRKAGRAQRRTPRRRTPPQTRRTGP